MDLLLRITLIYGFIFSMITLVKGSGIVLESTPTTVQPLITDDLSLRCSLVDGSPSASIIGRSLEGSHEDDQTEGIPTTDIKFVTTIVITRDGNDVAAISVQSPAKFFGNSTDVTVTGQMTGALGEKGYLQVNWKYPDLQQVGTYRCDVSGIDDHGHSFDFSKSVEVTEQEITMKDLIYHISQLKREKDDLKQTVDELKTNASHKIIFSVADPSPTYVPSGQVVVYSTVYTNIGGGYNVSTATFTTPVDGFYHFEMSALTAVDKEVNYDLQYNNKRVITIYCTAKYDYQSCSDSVALRLSQGDTVRVVARLNSYAFVDPGDEIYCTFTGQLITLA